MQVLVPATTDNTLTLLLESYECTILPCVNSTVSWTLGCLKFALTAKITRRTSLCCQIPMFPKSWSLNCNIGFVKCSSHKAESKLLLSLKSLCALTSHTKGLLWKDRHLHFLLISISCSEVIGALQKVLNKIIYKFTEVSECCWTCFLQMLRGAEQRQLKTDLVSLQFYFITVLNCHSTSIRHHTLVIEKINSLIKTRLASLYSAVHPSSLQLLASKTAPWQLDV